MTWVIGRYEGARAKSVIAHAESGIGYLILDRGGSSVNPWVLVASRCMTKPVPAHLVAVSDPLKVRDYERRLRQRQGLREE